MSRSHSTSIEDRALSLLGSGVAPEAAANALGVTASHISQLLSDAHFSEKVTTLRYESLQKHNSRDDKYDSIEDTLLSKLESSIPLMYKPHDILRAIATINGAKRRGQSTPQQITNQQNIINLSLPETILKKFVTNINNQVIKAGEEDLLTLPSSELLAKVEKNETPEQQQIEGTNSSLKKRPSNA